MSTTPKPTLTRAEILAAPPEQRTHYAGKTRVFYPRWNAILDEIELCHTSQEDDAEPPCLLLVGPTGAGKTTLINSYAERFPKIISPTSVICPVLKVTIPSPATVKNLASAMLHTLGDPRASSGTVGSLTIRLTDYFENCEVRLLLLDELQHFVDQDNNKILKVVSNWLKKLIKESGIACVLVGLQGEAEQVVATNEQLARLFGDPVVLQPFAWDEEHPETIQEFRKFLYEIEQVLPLREPSHLADASRAQRCFIASGGSVSYLMALIRQATKIALLGGRESIDDTCLANAFTRRLAGQRRGIINPFLDCEVVKPPSSPAIPPLNSTHRRGQKHLRKVQ